jgi:metal-responsive CopG/Arc/MetJ family transcriptional regulator
MARTAVTIGFSVPPETAELVERIAAREGRSKSELFRDMVRIYSVQRELEILEELAAYGAIKAAEAGVRTQADVERIIAEFRRGE